MRIREGPTYGMDAMTLARMNLGGLEPEMLDEFKKRPPQEARKTLHEGLRKLDFVVGRWTGSLSLPSAPGGTDPAAAKPAQPARSAVQFAAGGGARYLEGETRVGGFGYRMVLSYDAVQKRYRFSSVDDVSGLLDIYEGDFDSAGALVVSNVGSGTYYLTGTTRVHNRLTFAPLPGDVWEWRVDGSPDGGKTWVRWQTFKAERRLP